MALYSNRGHVFHHNNNYLQTQVDEEEDYDSFPQTSLFPVSQDTTLKGKAHQKNCRK